MKNIGLLLKNKREENGLSIEEVAEDLKMRPSQIASIEEGKKEDFKDVYSFKYFLRDYAKYLGLDSDKILDEFSEYLFDITSKIPVDLIENAKNDKKMTTKSTKSPYTKETKKVIKPNRIIIALIAVVLLVIIGYVVVSNHKGNEFSSSDITYSIRR